MEPGSAQLPRLRSCLPSLRRPLPGWAGAARWEADPVGQYGLPGGPPLTSHGHLFTDLPGSQASPNVRESTQACEEMQRTGRRARHNPRHAIPTMQRRRMPDGFQRLDLLWVLILGWAVRSTKTSGWYSCSARDAASGRSGGQPLAPVRIEHPIVPTRARPNMLHRGSPAPALASAVYVGVSLLIGAPPARPPFWTSGPASRRPRRRR